MRISPRTTELRSNNSPPDQVRGRPSCSSVSSKWPNRSLGRSNALWFRHSPFRCFSARPALGTELASMIRISRPPAFAGAGYGPRLGRMRNAPSRYAASAPQSGRETTYRTVQIRPATSHDRRANDALIGMHVVLGMLDWQPGEPGVRPSGLPAAWLPARSSGSCEAPCHRMPPWRAAPYRL